MASNIYTQHYSDGTSRKLKRLIKQGRKPSRLGKPKKFRLYREDEDKLIELKEILGSYYNENDIVRNAVHQYLLSNSVGTELVKQ